MITRRKLKINEFLAVVYADLFGYPLKRSEARLWAIDSRGIGIGQKAVASAFSSDGFWFLPGRERSVARRRRNNVAAGYKEKIARGIVPALARIPSVRAVFLTGSVAVGNATRDADVDLLVVTAPWALWLTRIAVVGLLRIRSAYRRKGQVRDRICTNIFLDEDNLEVSRKNLYTAHEVLQARCLFDRGEMQRKWLVRNEWAASYLPKAYETSLARENSRLVSSKYFVLWRLLFPLELLAFGLQYLYMRKRMSNEQVGWGYAWFHPKNLSEGVLAKFGRRLLDQKIGGKIVQL